MQLIVKSDFCRRKNCPKLFCDNDGIFYVQGYVVKNAGKMISGLPANETLVKIDASLLRQIKKQAIEC